MAIQRKPGPANAFSLSGQVPDMPMLPESFLGRFPELKPYQTSMTNWWAQFIILFQRDRTALTTELASLRSSIETQIADIQASIKTLTAEIDGISGVDLSALQAQVNAIQQSVSSFSATLLGHIGATVAHGTTSDIVGVSDAQTLDSKKLGLNAPGYGRVTAGIISLNRIQSNETIVVGPKDAMLVSGELSISGQLVIEGTLTTV